MSDQRIEEMIEEALSQTWAGGDTPVGPAVSSAFIRAVKNEKALARSAQELLAEMDALIAWAKLNTERMRCIESLLASTSPHRTGRGNERMALDIARAALAGIEAAE